MDGKVSEIIDNVLDTDDYNINTNTQESFNSTNSWTKLTYLDNKLVKKEVNKINLPSPIEAEKEENNNNSININLNNNKKEGKKILNENLFKGKGFRTHIDFFLKNNSFSENKGMKVFKAIKGKFRPIRFIHIENNFNFNFNKNKKDKEGSFMKNYFFD